MTAAGRQGPGAKRKDYEATMDRDELFEKIKTVGDAVDFIAENA